MRLLRAFALSVLAALLVAAPGTAAGRQNPLQSIGAPPPIGPKPPVGAGGCSITAPTCADVAPAIIHSALDPSVLERNIRNLTAILHASIDAQAKQQRVAQWAVRAFQRAGVDQARWENLALPSWAGSLLQDRRSASVHPGYVVAEIHGRENTGEFVVLAAPLDAEDPGSRAVANASNAAIVIDAARAIHAAGARPVRSIYFILFSEADGKSLGSLSYVSAHRSELNQIDAAIIYDAGSDPVNGYDLDGRKSLETRLRQALAPAAQFGANHDRFAPTLAADSFDFLLEGVPTLVTNCQPHTGSSANFDFEVLKRNVAFTAVSAYAIADLPQRLGSRQTRSQIEQLIARTGLAPKMRSLGIWSQWQLGQRGRRPPAER